MRLERPNHQPLDRNKPSFRLGLLQKWRSVRCLKTNSRSEGNPACPEPASSVCNGAMKPKVNLSTFSQKTRCRCSVPRRRKCCHTVVSWRKWKLSLIPSGILRENVTCVVTGGVVLDPASAIREIDMLESRGVKVNEKLRLSDRAHVVFPWHVIEDGILNGSLSGGESIGTTGRGIGPCYRDKVGRSLAIRLGDLYRQEFRSSFDHIVNVKQRFLKASRPPESDTIELDAETIFKQYQEYAERLRDYVGETTNYLLDSVESGKPLLFEGAQGALLDIDHGTFPFVTSSNSSGVGVSSGSGVPGQWITRTIGVLKAYSTRVGGGPFQLSKKTK